MIILLIFKANYYENKFYCINNLLCKSYNNNYYANIGSSLFLCSKYIEWIDTLFIHLSNKKISDLHYTHHMFTAFLLYHNIDNEIEAAAFVPFLIKFFCTYIYVLLFCVSLWFYEKI